MSQDWSKLRERWATERKRAQELARSRQLALAAKGRGVFERYGVQRAVVFGSVAEERCRESSDLDLLVMPLANQDCDGLRRELEEALGFTVDLYTDRDEPAFVAKILARGVTVYEVQP